MPRKKTLCHSFGGSRYIDKGNITSEKRREEKRREEERRGEKRREEKRREEKRSQRTYK